MKPMLALAIAALCLHASAAPVVSIVHPTNNQAFFSTDAINVVAEALNPDSAITNVQIFLGTNLIGDFASAPCFVSLTNLSPSTNVYSFSAIAVDESGAQVTSSVVSVLVKPSAAVTGVGPIALDRQNGLFEQFVLISNATPQSFPNGVRLFVILPAFDTTNMVWAPTGTNTFGVPYIDAPAPLPASAFTNVLVQYYVPNFRSLPNPTFFAEPVPFTNPPPPRPVLASARTVSAGFVIQFPTASNRLYYVQSSEDLAQWKTLPGLVLGSGGVARTTNAFTAKQFFRVLMLP